MRVWCLAVLAAALTVTGCDGRVSDAKKLVARDLKDPASAQFRDVHANGPAVCGEINSKNSYGAYVGFRRFVVIDGRARVEMDLASVDPNNVSDQLLHELRDGATFWDDWNQHCAS